MGTVVVKRPARVPAPELPTGELLPDPPPEIPPPGGRRVGQMLMMLPMLGGSAGMALLFVGNRGGALSYVAGGMFGLSAIGMIAIQAFTNTGQPSKQDMANKRRAYLRHISVRRQRARRVIERQREALGYRHPDPGTLWTTAASHRLWERRRADADFTVVRIGLGPQDLATPIVPPETEDVERIEPLCAAALRRFIKTHAIVPDLPVAMALNGFGRVYLTGDLDRARAMTRALVAQAATFHAPDDLLIAAGTPEEHLQYWEWLKWLPHVQHPDRHDRLGSLRLVTPGVASLEAMLEGVLASRPRFDPSNAAPQIAGPHVVVILDDADTGGSEHLTAGGGIEGVTVIELTTSPPNLLDRSSIVLEIAGDGTMRGRTVEGEHELGRADAMHRNEAEALARQLAPLRLSVASHGEQPLATDLGLAELLDLGDPYEFDPATTWGPRPSRSRLRVPIGITPDSGPIALDLKESAQEGMGPHGLLIGATGSGKSELLRTLVLALSVTHDPELLNFVLVDFKGGATFTRLDRLPHTSAVITNLVDELPLVDRMTDALNGEIIRRQELLRAAGNFSSLRDYDKARTAGASLAPVPTLLVIVDEFSELLSAKPDFIDMFVQIGRVGRSLGVHLLLASQRLEEGRLRGLDTHLSYRIALRTFSSLESRVVLGSPDAYELPQAPGHGWMKYATEPLTRFRAAYVSGVYRRPGAARRTDTTGDDSDALLSFTTRYLPRQAEPDVAAGEGERQRAGGRGPGPGDVEAAADDDDAVGETLLDILVDRLAGRGTRAHQVWLPPLQEPPTLDRLLPALEVDPDRGLASRDRAVRGALRARIGVVDRPFDQRRDDLVLELSGAGGHVAVVGGPQSGKSTAIRTLICSLALTHTPSEVQFYCLDFGGGSLASLKDLPHVGDVAGRLDTNRVRRMVAEVRTMLDQRESLFAQHAVTSIADYRRAKRQGHFDEDPWGDVFLVVDGWKTLREHFDGLEERLTDIASRGLNYGIHVIIASASWFELRQAIRDMLGTKVELRLADPNDSLLGRRTANNVPDGIPGRGITAEQLHMLIALPRVDGRQDASDLSDGVTNLVRRIRDAWPGPVAPEVRLLPDKVRYDEVADAGQPHRFAIGIAESTLQPVTVDFTTDAHFLLFGDTESGKSTFLRTLATSIVTRCTPAQARIILLDYRRSLLGTITTDHLIGYGTSGPAAKQLVADAAAALAGRVPGPDVTPSQLRSRSWWSGPELYVLVDDYDLVAPGSGTGGGDNPLTPLLEYLPHGRDIGLHLVVVRRSGGAGRAMFEPVIRLMRDLTAPGILLSGDRYEGALIGTTKPTVLPPGRGILVTRKGGEQLVQLPWLPPTGG